MSWSHFLLALLVTAESTADAPQSVTPDRTVHVADEAVAEAVKLPPGYKRDTVLRAVSRNLRWFAQPDAGLRAARAMTDLGVSEVPLGQLPRQPRYMPLKEALPTGSPCDAGTWREDGGREARSPKAREKWAEECLLTRDFHYIGRPDVGQVRTVAAGLRAGEIKTGVLAMLVRSYGDADSLRLVANEIDRDGAAMPAEARTALAAMLAEPESLYRLGRKSDALSAARTAKTFQPKAELISLLLRDGDSASAMIVFETLAATPPEYADGCDSWFNPIGGLELAASGYARNPSVGLAGFIDRLSQSAFFRTICPNGWGAEVAVEHLLAAGRLDAAVARARSAREQPFLLVDAALQAGEARLARGERDAARAHAVEAGRALPPFDRGDPVPAGGSTATLVTDLDADDGPKRNFGERSGDTHRRFEVIRLLAATGAVDEADALARAQSAGGLRAVALSAAAAGRAGLRFGDQVPSLDGIDLNDL